MPRLRELYEQPLPTNPAWISGGMLPKGGILLMGGHAKVGKTFLQLDMAHALATGGNVWGTEFKAQEPTSVLIAEQELGPYALQLRVKQRYDAIGVAVPESIWYMSKTKGLYLDTRQGQEILYKEIKSTDAQVVIIDPISRAFTGDENSNMDVQKIFTHLDEIIVERGDLSFVLVHHFGKPPKDLDNDWDPLSPYNFRGASKWFDAPDALITFKRKDATRPGEWWRLDTGWSLRQAAPPEEPIRLTLREGGLVTTAPVTPTSGWTKRVK